MRKEDLAVPLRMVPPHGQVVFARGLTNEALEVAYSSAGLLLFPSLAEGFGWPIIEAQACGCPVLTTAEPPRNEIGGPVCATSLCSGRGTISRLGAPLAHRLLSTCFPWTGLLAKSGRDSAGVGRPTSREMVPSTPNLRHYSEALAPVSASLHPSTLES
jgi:hypothetical protein